MEHPDSHAATPPAGTGLFVVFEGGDGAGKTTQADLLCSWLAAEGHDVVRTFEPGDSLAGRKIRELLLSPETGDLDPRAETLLYSADKAQHLHEVVRPALGRGAVVVCDRYVDSMLAYQGAGRTVPLEEVTTLARWATGALRPDLTVLLDVDPRESVADKVDKDRLESAGEAFHDRVRQGFLDLAAADPERYLVLPARREIRWIADQVATRVAQLLEMLSVPTGRIDP
ncbi:dTMP kinase [Microlunatus sp. Y2014]|uniref:dTMP kinase n=1 Tax=Microlunatus sp. Y2014 TaxID=3418488 RepID=UPI003DA78547